MILLAYSLHIGVFPVAPATAYSILHEMLVEVVSLYGYLGLQLTREWRKSRW